MLLAANKVDLVHVRVVSEEAGRELARALGAPYVETSAKEPPLNIDAAFHEVTLLAVHSPTVARRRPPAVFHLLTYKRILSHSFFLLEPKPQ